jgi:parvulin-like peptidyl-prolyl isomerase
MQAVKAQQPKTFSAPVRTRLGWHLLEVTGHESARPATLDECKAEIGALLEQHLGAKALEALLTRLRTEAGKLEVFNIDNLVLPRYQKEEQPPDP